MTPTLTTEILLICHAPALTRGVPAGRRRDVLSDCSDLAAFADLRAVVGAIVHRRISPALRCRQTAQAFGAYHAGQADAKLWDLDLGAWEGAAFTDSPNLSPLSAPELASHCRRGESLEMVRNRVFPALKPGEHWSLSGVKRLLS